MSEPRVWMITGASGGLGRALVVAALRAGDLVAACSRDTSALTDLAAEFGPQSVLPVQLDITHPSQISAAVMKVIDTFGRIDVLVNNAGVGLVGSVEETPDEAARGIFDVNFFGPMTLIRAALPHMRARRAGHIVNISAIAGICNEMGFGYYGASKFALEGASEALASEVRPMGIRVTLVEPGPFRTPFIARSVRRIEERLEDYRATTGKFAQMLSQIDGRQKGDPAKAARAILAVVQAESPPMRLVLGRYAIDKVRKKLASTETALAQWEAIGADTDLDPAR
jgi:NAD(P)-dependent dehydrogenase (short-subunit alcohol dehydrogenase family)